MIRLILRLCLLGLGILGPALVVEVVAVRQESLSDTVLQGLAHCNRPCWAGIEPGRTAFARVPTLVSARHPGRRFGQMAGHNAYSVTENGNWINISGQQGIVASVELNLPLELWGLVLLYGSPTCMEPLESVTRLYWVFSDSQIVANFFRANAGWRSHTLVLYTAKTDPCYQRDTRLPWRGWAGF